MIRSYQISLPGERQENEDSVLTAEAEGTLCFVLCDGLGGHVRGAEASRCACEAMEKAFRTTGGLPLTERICRAVDASEEALEASPPPRGQTTLCALMVDGDEACAAWVGDSRIYYFKNGEIVGHTLDHSVPQHLVRMGKITDAQIRHHEERNRLLRALDGNWDEPEYELWPLAKQIVPGDVFLLCSDGFWEWVEDEEMLSSLKSAESPQEWVERMKNLAFEKGRGKGMDNLSALAVWVEE